MDVNSATRPLLCTPCRFSHTSQNAYWNTGNGSPDAVCFVVDRPGICIAGVCVYGGGAHYNCEVELLEDVSIFSSVCPKILKPKNFTEILTACIHVITVTIYHI